MGPFSDGERLITNAETAFVDTCEWEHPRTLEYLPEYLRKYGFESKRTVAPTIASKKAGCPHTLVITAAGLRAADATRYGAPRRHILAIKGLQSAPHIPDKGRYRGQIVCQAHQVKGRCRIRQENKVWQSLSLYRMRRIMLIIALLFLTSMSVYYGACMPISLRLLNVTLGWALVSELPQESSTFSTQVSL